MSDVGTVNETVVEEMLETVTAGTEPTPDEAVVDGDNEDETPIIETLGKLRNDLGKTQLGMTNEPVKNGEGLRVLRHYIDQILELMQRAAVQVALHASKLEEDMQEQLTSMAQAAMASAAEVAEENEEVAEAPEKGVDSEEE